MLRLTPLQVLSVVKIAPGSGLAFTTPPASNDPIARAAIIAPRVNVNVFISFISIFLGLVFGLFSFGESFGIPLEFICRWDFLLVERMRSRQKWRQEECGRAPVCEGKLMRRPQRHAGERSANRGRRK